MAQSLSALFVHLVFSTKERRPFLRDRALRHEVFSYLAGISGQLDCSPIWVGGFDDHTHLLSCLGRTQKISDWVKELKRVSSFWLKHDKQQSWFEWQNGYAAFSVSKSNLEQVRRYVANQEAHHATQSFQDELRALLNRHGVKWNERYLWD